MPQTWLCFAVSSINRECRGGQGLLSWAVCVQQESRSTRTHLVVMSLHAGLADLLQRVLGELDHLLHCVCRGLRTPVGTPMRKRHCLTHAKRDCLKESLVGCFPHHHFPLLVANPVCPSDLPKAEMGCSVPVPGQKVKALLTSLSVSHQGTDHVPPRCMTGFLNPPHHSSPLKKGQNSLCN